MVDCLKMIIVLMTDDRWIMTEIDSMIDDD